MEPKTDKINYWNEFLLTFSSKRSFFSSKKIERFVVFSIMLTLTVIYVFFNIKKMEALAFVEVIGLWLVYGGYNTLMNQRDKTKPNEEDIPR